MIHLFEGKLKMQPFAEEIRRRYFSRPNEGEVLLNLLGGALENLDSARVGARLYLLPHTASPNAKSLFEALGEQHESLESAAKNLVFRCVMTSFDLCASAAWRAVGGAVPPNHEIAMSYWQTPAGRNLRASANRDIVAWVDSVFSNHYWSLLKAGRDEVTHRIIPRHVVSRPLSPDGLPARSNTTLIRLCDRNYDLMDLHSRLVDFGVEKWRQLAGKLSELDLPA